MGEAYKIHCLEYGFRNEPVRLVHGEKNINEKKFTILWHVVDL